MDLKEYRKKVEEIDHARDSAFHKLASEYAFSKNIVKRGDIVSSAHNSILVDVIRFHVPYRLGFPECTYVGPKAMVGPSKNGDQDRITQTNLKKINGKTI